MEFKEKDVELHFLWNLLISMAEVKIYKKKDEKETNLPSRISFVADAHTSRYKKLEGKGIWWCNFLEKVDIKVINMPEEITIKFRSRHLKITFAYLAKNICFAAQY